MQIRIVRDGALAPLSGYWDTVWSNEFGEGDWALDDPGGTSGSRGGLQAKAGLATAIIIALFTDKRAPEGAMLDDGDRRGWFGDRIDVREDLGEADLGSWIWLYERSALTDALPARVRDAAVEALEPIRLQGAVARFDVSVEMDRAADRLDLLVDAFSQDGTKSFSQRFALLWNQVN
ncbi:phage GP46 family protein [Bosea sp. TWI1241]|uniref:phage GP46 family protein n=1 Tax=Bosea sp. TWI1241 TaxID=3148904 RepID=UPI003209D7F0